MCGRYELNITPARVEKLFSSRHPPGEIPARHSLALGQLLPVCRLTREGERELAPMEVGADTVLGEDPKIAYKTINARAETVATSRAFRDAFKQKRPSGKLLHSIHMQDRQAFAFAGLWSCCKPPKGEPIETYTIVTTEPNELCAQIHDRMPVILDPADYTARFDDTLIAHRNFCARTTPMR